MTQKFLATDFFPRVIGLNWEDSMISKVIAALPICGRQGPWLAGGSLRRAISSQSLESDFDFFFADETQLKTFASQLENRGFTKKKETEHHEQWEGWMEPMERMVAVQLIRFQYYGSAEEVIDSFDFTICQFAYDGERIISADFALWDLGRKRLAVNKVTFPVSSMRRLLKYGRQGFTACDGCLAALAMAISDNPEWADNMNVKYVD